MVASLTTPLTVLHKNELEPELEAWLGDKTLPLVVGITESGDFSVVLDPSALERADGSVSQFATILASSLEAG